MITVSLGMFAALCVLEIWGPPGMESPPPSPSGSLERAAESARNLSAALRGCGLGRDDEARRRNAEEFANVGGKPFTVDPPPDPKSPRAKIEGLAFHLGMNEIRRMRERGVEAVNVPEVTENGFETRIIPLVDNTCRTAVAFEDLAPGPTYIPTAKPVTPETPLMEPGDIEVEASFDPPETKPRSWDEERGPWPDEYRVVPVKLVPILEDPKP